MQLFVFFYIMIDTRVNSDWTKTIIVTFVLKIINSKSVCKTTFSRGGFIWVNVIRRSSNQLRTDLDKN